MITTRKYLWFFLKGIVLSALLIAIILSAIATFVVLHFAGNAYLPADCGLVFGAAVHRAGDAGPGIERRVQTAVRLYREEMIQALYLSGGKGSAGQESEAAVMRKVAFREGVDPDDVFLEESASSTVENLTFAKEMMGDCPSVVGISDRYHLARIAIIADTLDWKNFSVHPSDQSANSWFEVRSVVRETFALVHFFLTTFLSL